MSPSTPRVTPEPTPPDLRFLKLLVTTLAGVMIVGLVIIIVLLVIRMTAAPVPAPLALPESIALPEGTQVQAITLAPGVIVVLSETEILIFNRASGQLERRYPLD